MIERNSPISCGGFVEGVPWGVLEALVVTCWRCNGLVLLRCVSSSTCSIQVCGGARRGIEAESAFRWRWFCCNGGRHGCKRRFLLGAGFEEGVLRGGAQECVQEARFGIVLNRESPLFVMIIVDLRPPYIKSRIFGRTATFVYNYSSEGLGFYDLSF